MKRYSLYLDESGIADLTNTSYKNFLLTGLVMKHDEDRELSGYFNFLKRRHHLDQEKSFHAYDLFENKYSSKYLSEDKAKRLCLSLSEFIKIIPIKIKVVSVDKNLLKSFLRIKTSDDLKGSEEKRRDKEIPYEILSAELFLWFSNFVKKERGRGGIIAESRKNADYTLLRTYLKCHEPNSFRQKSLKKSCENMGRHISSIRFESKIGVWPGLELADIISYISFLKLNKRIRKSQFRKRGLIDVWHQIEKKMEDKKIRSFSNSESSKYINPDRVRKMSKDT